MAKIKILPRNEALKIAAGEVIERPSHVVKELVENSLDAGSTSISVYIQKAGKELIRIVDNGSGMTGEDAKMCFLPHATSKISCMDELEHVTSYGFRGEALASVSAVSNVVLITKPKEAPVDALGVSITYSQDCVQQEIAVACPCGTDIQVRDLFFNTPVRKKFLKQDDTEWNAIQNIVYAFCFSHSHVHFKLYHDDRLMLNAPPAATCKDRALQVWEHNIGQQLIPLCKHEGTIHINGYISHHNFWRYGRQNIYFFVNNRWVKNNELSKAIMKGYTNVLPPDRFPAAVIFISIDSQLLDINVHPKKEEVRFAKPLVVQTELVGCIKKTLEERTNTVIGEKNVEQNSALTLPQNSFEPYVPQPYKMLQPDMIKLENTRFMPVFDRGIMPEKTVEKPMVMPIVTQDSDTQEFKIIGQLFNTYIVLERGDSVVFIDQHAAHERILYERYTKKFEIQHGTTLLFPESFTLSQIAVKGLMTCKDFFERQGILFDVFADDQIVIRAAPPMLKGTPLKELIEQAADFIIEHEQMERSLFDKKINEHIHAQIACKSAVKAGDVLTMVQMHQLITDLGKTPNRFICVHGRPTTWSIPKSDVEKKFKRT